MLGATSVFVMWNAGSHPHRMGRGLYIMTSSRQACQAWLKMWRCGDPDIEEVTVMHMCRVAKLVFCIKSIFFRWSIIYGHNGHAERWSLLQCYSSRGLLSSWTTLSPCACAQTRLEMMLGCACWRIQQNASVEHGPGPPQTH